MIPAAVRAAWKLPDDVRVRRLGRGHINATWRVERSDAPALVLQQLNTTVFADAGAVMGNLLRVLDSPAAAATPLRLVAPATGDWLAAHGQAWRAFEWVADSLVFQAVPNTALCQLAAAAFGRFSAALAGLEAGSFAVIIPRFFDFDARRQALAAACEAADAVRLAQAQALLELASTLWDRHGTRWCADRACWPKQLTHNDGKLNNVLFASSGRPIGVVDLDTVMPQDLYVEFGDLVRALAMPGPEDHRGDTLRVDATRLAAAIGGFLRGYRSGAALPAPAPRLASAPACLGWLLGIRFLADWLAGDRYFPAADPQQNLRRARGQLLLAAALAQQVDLVGYLLTRGGSSWP